MRSSILNAIVFLRNVTIKYAFDIYDNSYILLI